MFSNWWGSVAAPFFSFKFLASRVLRRFTERAAADKPKFMATLFHKFQEFVKILAKNPMFAKDPRQLQFEADVNRLFLYTSYNRLGKNADEADADEIISMASKASLADQQRQVQENIHYQFSTFCASMDEVLLPDFKNSPNSVTSTELHDAPRRSGLSFAVGRTSLPANKPGVPETRLVTRTELSHGFKVRIGYTLDLKPSQIPHKDAGQGLFLSGEADVGSVIAFYPGVIYSPAYYRNIPGYPRVDAQNPYLITRYDGVIINAQPWGSGGETREFWDGFSQPQISSDPSKVNENSDRFWRLLSKPLDGRPRGNEGEVLERRNPLAFGHFANHPAKGAAPNVMVCPYDFPVTENKLRAYIPNIVFGSEEKVSMKRFGSFWFKTGGSGDVASDIPVVKTLVLVATRALCDEEVFLNYRLSNSKRRPEWYAPVDEEEDRRRWS